MRYSPERFVEVWQSSSSLAEAAKQLAMSPQGASSKASRYRALGIGLKSWPRSGRARLDTAKLAELAKRLA